MKSIKFFMIALCVLVASACDKNDLSQTEPVYLEVNANNISGQWELAEWNGAAMQEGTYVYLDIVRNDRTYTMYQNLDSFTNVPHKVSGSYYIEYDPELGAILRGNYDHDSGDWAHRYIVKDLTATEMYWIAKDDRTFIQKYVRVDSIPVE